MHAMIDETRPNPDEEGFLLHDHVFQFDFLNDSLEKLPEELREIVEDKEKRKKLIVYINPPYAEATNARTITGTGKNRIEVSKRHDAHEKYKDILGKAANELYSLFMIRVADKLQGSLLAVFSTLKYINSSNFAKFRSTFSAKFQKGFVCRADTFDNVDGKFHIGFAIWQLSHNGYDFQFPKTVKLDVLDNDGKRIAKKSFYNGRKSINKWIKEFDSPVNNSIGFMGNPAPDFQNINQPYITLTQGTRHFNYFTITAKNILEGCIYFAVRLCIEQTWLNNQDQFLFPDDDGYKKDKVFQYDCLVFTLFHGKNFISCNDGINHWIPFSEQEVDAKGKFKSNFMHNFIKDVKFSKEAKKVLDSGLKLWKYYHLKTKNNKTVSVNASFYDIREYFQGRNENGKMNTKSTDETYSKIIKTLRTSLNILAQKIEPKIYEYGFLK
jgi:hypothetical protein